MRLLRFYLAGMFLFGIPLFARADSLFVFTLTGDGHTFQFTTPNPPVVADHPHDVDVTLGPVAGTVDGTGGYTFAGDVTAISVSPSSPSLLFYISPLPPNTPTNPSSPYGTTYALFGGPITTLVSDVPNPVPVCYIFSVCNDLLTFSYVPGDYTLYGYGPDLDLSYYSLDIAAVPDTATTPEPGSWVLTVTGVLACAVLAGADRRRRSPS